MRAGVNALFAVAALVWPLAASLPLLLAPDARADEPEREDGADEESRWVASLAATSGVWFQSQEGRVDSCLFANPADLTGSCPAANSTPLRAADSGDDLAIFAFVGANLELMSPALPLPARPRVFVSGEILPTFAAERDIAGEGDPSCIQGPRPSDVGVCQTSLDPNIPRDNRYGQDDALGAGSVVTTTYDTLSYGANVGLAFPAQVGERRLRIKPSFGWLSYKAELEGRLVDGKCTLISQNPFITQCTDVDFGPPVGVVQGGLRETVLTGSDSRRFHAIGPGLDIEMDTGRFGPLGTSLFIGGRAYYTFGDRRLESFASEVYPNDGLPLAGQASSAEWEAQLDRWIYRAGLGLRIRWLGGR